MKQWLSAILLFGAMAAAHAAPVTLSFSASGFRDLGAGAVPDFAGPIHGSFSWEADAPTDPITKLTAIDLAIAGHVYSLAEVDILNGGPTTATLGGKARGTGTLVGDGGAHDFMLVFNRLTPQIMFFGYTVYGASNSLWAYPEQSEIRFVAVQDDHRVPEPASFWLLGCGLLALALHQAARSRHFSRVSRAEPRAIR